METNGKIRCEYERGTSSTSSNEAQIVKPGDLMLEVADSIAQFGGAILIVACSQSDAGIIRYGSEGYDAERLWQRFV